jgi:hypothetical protein
VGSIPTLSKTQKIREKPYRNHRRFRMEIKDIKKFKIEMERKFISTWKSIVAIVDLCYHDVFLPGQMPERRVSFNCCGCGRRRYVVIPYEEAVKGDEFDRILTITKYYGKLDYCEKCGGNYGKSILPFQ